MYTLASIQSQFTSGFNKGKWKISTAETKIILVLCYYALFGLLSLSYFSMESQNQAALFVAIQHLSVKPLDLGQSATARTLTNSGIVVYWF